MQGFDGEARRLETMLKT